MTGRVAARILWCLLSLLNGFVLVSCKREQPALAQITVVVGAVEGQHHDEWQEAVVGRALFAGDGVRTGAAARAILRFGSGREIRMSERSLIRLGTDDASSVHVTVELGEADIEGDGTFTVATAQGAATLDPGTRLKVRVSGNDIRFEVSVGRAVLGQGDDLLVIGDGEGVALRIGSAQVERYRIEVGAAEMEPATAAAPASGQAQVDAGVPGVGQGNSGRETAAVARTAGADRAPGAVDLTVPTGESAVIHGRQTPLVIRMRLEPPCATGGSVTLTEAGGFDRGRSPGRQRASGREHAFLTVAAGKWGYRYECDRAEVSSGTLAVRRDSGLERLPRAAPVNTIDADGRRYTVLYQNRLPSLTFAWPGAPAQESYELQVEGKGRNRSYPVDSPRLRLASGALPEGTYQWWFTGADGRASPRTSVTVRFDNAAIAGQVESPRDGARVAPGTEIEVAGVALEGSTVVVGSAPLPVDEQGRFRGLIPPPSTDERSIAIRLAHPKSGVHYYIRRIGEGTPSLPRAPSLNTK